MKSQFQIYTLQSIQIKARKFLNYKSLPPILCSSTISVQIQQNDIQDIDILSKYQYPHLQHFSIRMNQITYIPRLKTTNVKKLILQNNQISDITAFAQGYYPEMTSLQLDHNLITVLPRLKTPNLRDLYASNNLIESLDEFFTVTYHKLFVLSVRNNKLTKLSIIRAPSIRHVHFQGNLIQETEECLFQQNHPFLTSVNLYNNRIKNIDSIQVRSLVIIILKGNQISQIDKFGLFEFPLLTQLHINENLIKNLPQLNVPKLHSLYADSNLIESIDSFAHNYYSELQIIYIRNNKLKSLPAFKTLNLTLLYCHDNAIQDIHAFCLQKYQKLEVLDLSQNLLTGLPTLPALNLRQLKINSNPLVQISNLFFSQSYQKLKKFSISFDNDSIVKCFWENAIEMLAKTFPINCQFQVHFQVKKSQNDQKQSKIIIFLDKTTFAFFIKDKLKEIETIQKQRQMIHQIHQKKAKVKKYIVGGALTLLLVLSILYLVINLIHPHKKKILR